MNQPLLTSVPPIMFVGWIPYRALPILPKGKGYQNLFNGLKGWQWRFACWLLFASGNLKPKPDDLMCKESFTQHLRRREYRAAFGFFSMTLRKQPGGTFELRPPAFNPDFAIGYTPLPFLPPAFRRALCVVPRLEKYLYFKGLGRFDRILNQYNPRHRTYTVAYSVRFRIGDKGARVGQKYFGITAPYLNVQFYFVFDLNKRKVLVRTESTAIPSQTAASTMPGRPQIFKEFHDMCEIDLRSARSVFQCRNFVNGQLEAVLQNGTQFAAFSFEAQP